MPLFWVCRSQLVLRVSSFLLVTWDTSKKYKKKIQATSGRAGLDGQAGRDAEHCPELGAS